MSYRYKKVYKCDICEREKPREYLLGYDADSSSYGPPNGWTHRGGRNGVTVCDECKNKIGRTES